MLKDPTSEQLAELSDKIRRLLDGVRMAVGEMYQVVKPSPNPSLYINEIKQTYDFVKDELSYIDDKLRQMSTPISDVMQAVIGALTSIDYQFNGNIDIGSLLKYTNILRSSTKYKQFFTALIGKILSYAAYKTGRYNEITPYATQLGITLETSCQRIANVAPISEEFRFAIERESDGNGSTLGIAQLSESVNKLLTTISEIECKLMN